MWIINGKDVFYNQYSTVTFLCPMRFERYPLDEHICRSETQKIDSVMKNINFLLDFPMCYDLYDDLYIQLKIRRLIKYSQTLRIDNWYSHTPVNKAENDKIYLQVQSGLYKHGYQFHEVRAEIDLCVGNLFVVFRPNNDNK